MTQNITPDDFDIQIIALLQRDGRLTNAELAEEVGLSPSACHRRVKNLEQTGVITGYTAVVDRRKIGQSLLAYVLVKLETHTEGLLEQFVQGVQEIDEVVACYAISGTGDYLLKIVARDMDAFSEIALKKLVRLPSVKDSSTNFVLSTLKLAPGWPVQ